MVEDVDVGSEVVVRGACGVLPTTSTSRHQAAVAVPIAGGLLT